MKVERIEIRREKEGRKEREEERTKMIDFQGLERTR